MAGAPDVRIRQARPEDFDAWFALFDAVAGEGVWIAAEHPLDREARRRTFDETLASADAVTLLAEVDGAVVGILGTHVQHGVAGLGMLVDAAWRGRGVGAALLSACIEWARGHGAHKVWLEVWPHNAPARALYRRFGFEEEALLRRHYRRRDGALWDAVGMGLVLDEAAPGGPPDDAAGGAAT